jgi:hypothetical protein
MRGSVTVIGTACLPSKTGIYTIRHHDFVAKLLPDNDATMVCRLGDVCDDLGTPHIKCEFST